MKINALIIVLLLISSFLSAQVCTEYAIPAEGCDAAPILCNLNGYCSNNFNAVADPEPLAFCSTVENDVWVSFIADSPNLNLEIHTSNCENGDGMQAVIFETIDCDTFTAVSNCWNFAGVNSFILYAVDMEVGERYYILLDGLDADRCDFRFEVLQGETQVPDWAQSEEFVSYCEDVGMTTLVGINTNPSPNAVIQWLTDDGNIISDAQQLNIDVNMPGNYFMIVTDTFQNCVDIAEVFVEEYELPDAVVVMPIDTLDCLDNLTVNVQSQFISSEPNIFYNWYNEAGISVGQTWNVNIDTPGEYVLSVFNDVTGCERLEPFQVYADANTPVAQIEAVEDLNCLNSSILFDTQNSSQNPANEVVWTTDTGNFLNGETTLTPEVNGVGWYFLTLTNAENGCVAMDSVEVTGNPLSPDSIALTILNPCFGEETGSLQIDSVFNGNLPYVFSLENGDFSTNRIYNSLAPQSYLLTVEDAVGCTFDTLISIDAQPQLVVNLGVDLNVLLGDSIIIEPIINLPIDSFTWSNTDYFPCEDCLSNTITPLQAIDYEIKITDPNGCTASDELHIEVDTRRRVYIPNAFSPDDNGVNDLFYIQAGSDVKSILQFQVFDRWGNLLMSHENFQTK